MGDASDPGSRTDFLAGCRLQPNGRGSRAGRAFHAKLFPGAEAIDGANRAEGRARVAACPAPRGPMNPASPIAEIPSLPRPATLRIAPPSRWWALPFGELWDF